MRKEILFIIENLRGGGAEKVLLDLLRRFDYTHYHVSLHVAYPEGVYKNDIPKEVELIFLYKKNHTFCRKAFRYYKRYGGFSYMLRYQLQKRIKNSYDVIVSFLEGRALLLHSLIRDKGGMNITWVHSDLSTYHWTMAAFPSLSAEKKCYATMDKIVFVSHQAMNSFSNMFALSVPATCIYNIIDTKHIQALAAKEEISYPCFTVTTMGTLNRVKAFEKLVYVAKRFSDAGYSIHFQIIGEGDKEEQLKKLCHDLKVQAQVHFLGFMNNPYPYLKSSDMYVSTSLSEGFSLVIGEAMGLGVPVAATRTAGATELLDEGRCGVLTEHDEEDIYKGIKMLVDDERLRSEYAEKALRRSEIFAVDKIMQQIYGLFN